VGTKQGPAASSERERFWRKLVAGQARSGVSIREWCDRRGVSEPSFYFWRRELARRKAQRQEVSSQIVPVDVTRSVAGSRCGLEIELPGQIVVRVGHMQLESATAGADSPARRRPGGRRPSHAESPLAGEDLRSAL
jgi:hypothetical protein